MRIIICGSRKWRNTQAIHQEIDRLHTRYGDELVIVHGDEPNGADNIARVGCEQQSIRHEEYCATTPRFKPHERYTVTQVSDWNKDGLKAGPLRNRAMLESGVDGVVAFHLGGKGTQGMINIAVDAGVRTIVRDGKNTFVYWFEREER